MDIIDDGKNIPLNLGENETFEIETIQDLLNCPINMYGEVIKLLGTAWQKRIEQMEKSGKVHVVNNCKLSVINDGIDVVHTDIRINGIKEN